MTDRARRFVAFSLANLLGVMVPSATLAIGVEKSTIQPKIAEDSDRGRIAPFAANFKAPYVDPLVVMAPLQLTRRDNIGFAISSNNISTFNIGGNQFLISLDGEDLKGLSLEQITAKLFGPPGSKFTVETLLRSGQVSSTEMERPSIASYKDDSSVRDLENELYQLTRGSVHPNLLENSYKNCDLISKFFCEHSVQNCNKAGSQSRSECSCVLTESMILSFSIGDFQAGEKYLQELLGLIRKSSGKWAAPHGTILKFAVRDLIALHRKDEATTLCEAVFKSSSASENAHELLALLETLSSIDTSRAQKLQVEIATKTAQMLSASQSPWFQDCFFLCNFFQSIGMNSKALELYTIEANHLRKQDRYNEIESCQPLASCLYEKSRLECSGGDLNTAKSDLNSILELYQHSLTERTRSALERLPGFFPNESAVKLALRQLENSQPIARAPYTYSAPFGVQPEVDSNNHELPIELQLPEAQRCFTAIKNGEKTSAEKIATELVSHYQSEVSMPRFATRRQNLFCTILRIARALADKEWYQSADALLTKLRQSINSKNLSRGTFCTASTMITAESLYNAYKSKNDQKQWMQDSQLVAMAYHYADEPKRATFFITQAIRTKGNASLGASPSRNPNTDNFLLFMNAACIYAADADNNFLDAAKFIDKAFTYRDYDINEKTVGAVVEYVELCSRRGHEADSIAIIEKTKTSGTTTNANLRNKLQSSLDQQLAKQLAAAGKGAEASKILQDIAKRDLKQSSPEDLLFIAKKFESAKNYREAARYYELATRRELNPRHANRDETISKLRKAIECAQKVSDFDPTELAGYYVKLSDQVAAADLTECISLKEKAISLFKNSAPQKAEQLFSCAYLRQEIISRDFKTKALTAQAKAQSEAKQLTEMSTAVSLAEQNKSPLTSRYLLTLARYQAQSHANDKAYANARRAIAMYTAGSDEARFSGQAFSGIYPSPLTDETLRLSTLLFEDAIARVSSEFGASSIQAQAQMAHAFQFYVASKRFVEAEKILDRILQTDLGQGTYQIPNHDMFVCGIGPYPLNSSFEVIGMIEGTAEPKIKDRLAFAVVTLNKLLAAERKQFPSDDRRIGLTLARLGSIYSAMDDNAKADTTYDAAMIILRKYEPLMFVLGVVGTDYIDVLTRVGKKDVIARLEEEKIEEAKRRAERLHGSMPAQPEISLENRSSSELRKIFEDSKTHGTYLTDTDMLLSRLCRVARQKHDTQLAAEICKQRITAAVQSRNQPRPKELERELTEIYIQAGKLDEAEVLSQKLLADNKANSWERTNCQLLLVKAYEQSNHLDSACRAMQKLWDSDAKELWPAAMADRDLIKLLFKVGKLESAKAEVHQLLQHHAQWLPNLKLYTVAIELVELALRANETDFVPDLLSKGEELAKNSKHKADSPFHGENGNFDLQKFADLWKKLGCEKKSEETVRAYNSYLSSADATGFRPPSASLRAMRVEDLTRSGETFPPAHFAQGYSFNFVALASQSLRFEDGSQLCNDKSSVTPVFAGTFGHLRGAQSTGHAGKLSFIFEPGSSGQKSVAGKTRLGFEIPNIQSQPFKVPIQLETETSDFVPASGAGVSVGVSPGDYESTSLTLDEFQIEGPGKVRIFINQRADREAYAVHISPRGLVNAQVPTGPARADQTLEVWYAGTSPIKLDRDSTFNGIIYAPNAKVEIGPGYATFTGAIVAKEIVLTGNTRIFWDSRLSNWKPNE